MTAILSGTFCTINAGLEADVQHSVDKFSTACTNFGPTISSKTTEVRHQPAPGKAHVEPDVTRKGQRLNAVNEFTYLGSTLSQNVTIEYGLLNVRIAKSSGTFGRLRANVWNRLQTKLKITGQ